MKTSGLFYDHKGSAKAARLSYINNQTEGIERVTFKSGFRYLFKGKLLTNKNDLERIRKLAIPPAWRNVWICKSENGHIQATGYDVKNRKQYRYHSNWNSLRNETKFLHMLDFGRSLPKLRSKMRADLAQKNLTADKVIATIVNLMEQTYIRIGNESYEKQNGSHGISTMKDRHVNIRAGTLTFCFKGKKGIEHTIKLNNKKIAKIVKECRDIPGKELFQYIDDKGQYHKVDSGMVNSYIREATGGEFSAKDFRTWAGTLHALEALKKIGVAPSLSVAKKNIVEALDFVSEKLGNSRTVCKKYYVNPVILELYENNELLELAKKNAANEKATARLSSEEKLMMKILKVKNSAA
jgi:DNA topoisomerase-1